MSYSLWYSGFTALSGRWERNTELQWFIFLSGIANVRTQKKLCAEVAQAVKGNAIWWDALIQVYQRIAVKYQNSTWKNGQTVIKGLIENRFHYIIFFHQILGLKTIWSWYRRQFKRHLPIGLSTGRTLKLSKGRPDKDQITGWTFCLRFNEMATIVQLSLLTATLLHQKITVWFYKNETFSF